MGMIRQVKENSAFRGEFLLVLNDCTVDVSEMGHHVHWHIMIPKWHFDADLYVRGQIYLA